ncbi:efflux RND transporter periplasmic adaptor subunit [Shewanella abyssi]|uniref:efflux RND transporter periplasmic adaptor subunit n=1 Tax=Shewanella abyssi TaxID=311789 RepID=UPI00200EF68C|nr:efflux RND transporter periplasmic adaptor subunit [Shewanella abyssi]MCL1051211.1 efflux RND transporter periplasmic adaptor subunit [Shewanella abyssi]
MDIKRALTRRKLLISLAVVSFLSACQDAPVAPPEAPNYQSVSSSELIAESSYSYAQEFSGTIRAGNTTGVGFELAGKINALTVDSGDSVVEGQLLAQLDTRLLQAEKNELLASLAQNKADLDLATATLNRSLELKKQGYVSEQQLDELKGQLNSLLAAKSRFNAAIQSNQLKIEKSDLLAPFNGTISKRSHNLGEVIALGSPVFTLIQHHNVQAYIGVPIAVSSTLTTGQQVDLRVRNKRYQANIAGIGAQLDPVTRTVELRVTLPSDADVINGELSYFAYQHAIDTAGYWVPISALTDGIRGLWNIYVLTQDGEQRFRIERRDVEIIYTAKDKAFINGAIKANEAYVDQGLHKLVAGQIVTRQTNLATR